MDLASIFVICIWMDFEKRMALFTLCIRSLMIILYGGNLFYFIFYTFFTSFIFFSQQRMIPRDRIFSLRIRETELLLYSALWASCQVLNYAKVYVSVISGYEILMIPLRQ